MANILVVDDSLELRAWLGSILQANGHQVEKASDGSTALTYLKRAKPALVVLDLFLPMVDGLELIIHIRSSFQPIKILAISGNPIPEYDSCAVAKLLGADKVLPKPFSAETFLNHVEALLPRPS